jgi:hypothetical protein
LSRAAARLDVELQTDDVPADGSTTFSSTQRPVELFHCRVIAAPTTMRVRLLAADNAGERVVGEYRFSHSPYAV